MVWYGYILELPIAINILLERRVVYYLCLTRVVHAMKGTYDSCKQKSYHQNRPLEEVHSQRAKKATQLTLSFLIVILITFHWGIWSQHNKACFNDKFHMQFF